MLLSVIIPNYNEEKTIEIIVEKVIAQKKNIDLEIIVVDDFSSDKSKEILNRLKSKGKIDHLILQEKNYGKGFAIQTALKMCSGKIIIIQDADLEYDPMDFQCMLNTMKQKKLRCLYGSRVLGKNRYNQKNFTSFFRVFANHILTIFTNIIYRQKLTDAHTCYKMVETNLIKSLNLKEKKFAFCPELTAKVSKRGVNILECEISYKGRTYEEGKKINFFDGLEAIWVLIKYRFYD
tara:strand:+ start:21839 stop:22543 length:705 start_codon:yes stop_codon:yes gene_type:complete